MRWGRHVDYHNSMKVARAFIFKGPGHFAVFRKQKSWFDLDELADLTIACWSGYFAAIPFGQGMVVCEQYVSLVYTDLCRMQSTMLTHDEKFMEATKMTFQKQAKLINEKVVQIDNADHYVRIAPALSCSLRYIVDSRALPRDRVPQLGPVSTVCKRNL